MNMKVMTETTQRVKNIIKVWIEDDLHNLYPVHAYVGENKIFETYRCKTTYRGCTDYWVNETHVTDQIYAISVIQEFYKKDIEEMDWMICFSEETTAKDEEDADRWANKRMAEVKKAIDVGTHYLELKKMTENNLKEMKNETWTL